MNSYKYMPTSAPVLDATQSIFFARQLELIESKNYQTKYPDLEAEQLLPNRIQVPAGVDKYTWRLFNGRGEAVPMAGNEDGAPQADVDGAESSTVLMSWVSGFGYNVEEIAAAAFAGMPLEQMRAEVCRRKLAEALNKMALLGNANRGITGLFNQAGTQTYSVPATGASSGTLWTSKTADQVLLDMFSMVDSLPNNTIDIEGGATRPLTFLMSKASMRLISTLRLGTSAQDTTVLEFFKRQRPNVTLGGANYLPTAASGGLPRAMVYDPAQVSWLVSIPFEQMPVQQEGFRFNINCRSRGGGVVTPFPKSIIYADSMA